MSSTVVPHSTLETSVPGLWKQPPIWALTYLSWVESDLWGSCKVPKCCLIIWGYVGGMPNWSLPVSYLYTRAVYADACGYVDMSSAAVRSSMRLRLSETRQLPFMKLSSTLLREKKSGVGLTEKEPSTCEPSNCVHQTETSIFTELVIKVVQMPVILRN